MTKHHTSKFSGTVFRQPNLIYIYIDYFVLFAQSQSQTYDMTPYYMILYDLMSNTEFLGKFRCFPHSRFGTVESRRRGRRGVWTGGAARCELRPFLSTGESSPRSIAARALGIRCRSPQLLAFDLGAMGSGRVKRC